MESDSVEFTALLGHFHGQNHLIASIYKESIYKHILNVKHQRTAEAKLKPFSLRGLRGWRIASKHYIKLKIKKENKICTCTCWDLSKGCVAQSIYSTLFLYRSLTYQTFYKAFW